MVLPNHLRRLAGVADEAVVAVAGPITLGAVVDALEARYPVLRGTIRDQATGARRPFLRFFACGEDLSHQPPDTALPGEVAAGSEPLFVVAAIAGGEPQEGRVVQRKDWPS